MESGASSILEGLLLLPLCTDRPLKGNYWRWGLTHAASCVWKKHVLVGGGKIKSLIVLGVGALGFCSSELPVGAGSG